MQQCYDWQSNVLKFTDVNGNKYNLKFNLKASTLTLPNNASVGNVAMGIDNNYKTTSENGI